MSEPMPLTMTHRVWRISEPMEQLSLTRTFDEIRSILEDPRTLRIARCTFVREGTVFQLDPLDMQMYHDESLREMAEFLGLRKKRTTSRFERFFSRMKRFSNSCP